MAKLSAKKQKAIVAATIQSAVCGFIIPMMSIPKLYRTLESAVAAGKSETELKLIVAEFPGVTESI